MRLLEALSESNPTDNSSAINRSGTRPVRVVSVVVASELDAYEVDDANPTGSSAGGPLFSSVSAADMDEFFASHGYNLDPQEWYPG